jgi:hypothetical protein
MSGWAADGELTVLVPEPGDFSDQWFLSFTRSGLGLALACHADRIETSEGDIHQRVSQYYAERGNTGNENYAVEVDLVQTPLAISIDAFDRGIEKLASYVRLDFKGLDRVAQQALREACFEAIENVGDHAFRAPWPEKAVPFSYFSLRYHKNMGSANVPGAELHGYLERIPKLVPEDRDQLGFIEVVVTDNGNGIARRHRLDLDLCEGSIEDEDAALAEAFEATGSVKLKAGDSFVRGEPGFGFSYISRGLQRLNAYAILRTGRRVAVLDGSFPAPNPGWIVADEQLAMIPGTTFQMYFPLISPQLHLPRPNDS